MHANHSSFIGQRRVPIVVDRSAIQRSDTEALDRGAIHDYVNLALSN